MKLLLSLLLVVGVCGVAYCYPIHASCHLTWTLGESCPSVITKLVSQAKKWGMDFPCNSSEKCKYQVKEQTSKELTLTHTTPVKGYVDDLTFNFNSTSTSGSCLVKGYSTSETWYAVLDSGTNYCNLRNLADGSGLSKSPGFSEDTSDSICTQFSSHDCGKY